MTGSVDPGESHYNSNRKEELPTFSGKMESWKLSRIRIRFEGLELGSVYPSGDFRNPRFAERFVLGDHWIS